jgi:hypothetical protein
MNLHAPAAAAITLMSNYRSLLIRPRGLKMPVNP